MSDDWDEIKGLLLIFGIGVLLSAGLKLTSIVLGGERYVRIPRDMFGYRKGQLVRESELREALEAERDRQQAADEEPEELHCPSCGAVVQSINDIARCDWDDKEICASCAIRFRNGGTYCSEECEWWWRRKIWDSR